MKKLIIIYPKDDGGVAIIAPCANTKLSIDKIAEKDVPKGKPFQIIDSSMLPKSREFRNAWEYVQEKTGKGA